MTSPLRAPATVDIEKSIFRVHLWVRLLTALMSTYHTFQRQDRISHPVLAYATDVFMILWTALTSWRYLTRDTRRRWLFRVDWMVTTAIVLVSPLVLGEPERFTGLSLAGYWTVGAPLALAIHGGWVMGAISSLALAAITAFTHPSADPGRVGDLLLMSAAAAGMGYLVDQLRRSIIARDSYYATAALLSERERLNRIVHDGVLQVLAMVEREGPALGPRGSQLAKAARQQETSLRAMLQDRSIDVAAGDTGTQAVTNLTSMLDAHGSDTVTISSIADDIMMDRNRAAEIDNIVSEVLLNVAKHAGPEAHAWLLLEDDGPDVVISVRDNGVGADPEVINAAGGRGRMGVQNSIYGRVRDLGGEATLRAQPGRGVEWEFRIPVE